MAIWTWSLVAFLLWNSELGWRTVAAGSKCEGHVGKAANGEQARSYRSGACSCYAVSYKEKSLPRRVWEGVNTRTCAL
ncbi:hypothetical protein B0H14DRAFT_2950443 [Mycena olivaceomarginata]|nr:hypothetical protein B0H14DRAFT_2950443 [Mycena olivaceomarginata]